MSADQVRTTAASAAATTPTWYRLFDIRGATTTPATTSSVTAPTIRCVAVATSGRNRLSPPTGGDSATGTTAPRRSPHPTQRFTPTSWHPFRPPLEARRPEMVRDRPRPENPIATL